MPHPAQTKLIRKYYSIPFDLAIISHLYRVCLTGVAIEANSDLLDAKRDIDKFQDGREEGIRE